MNIPEAHLSHFHLLFDGQPAPAEIMDALLRCTVENSLHLPDACTLQIYDAGFHWLDSSLFQEGRALQVSGGEGPGTLTPMFWGEITGLELDLDARSQAPTLIVRAYDRSHRLQRGRGSRSFVNKTDTDIVRQIGTENGFRVHAEATAQVHDWVLQNNQSNWEFLTERAERNGYRLYVQGERDLYFVPVRDEENVRGSLEWGVTLRSFRARISVSQQISEVVVRGWDQHEKSSIIGRCKRPQGTPRTGDGRTGGEIAQRAFGEAKMIVVDRPVNTQGEANDLARSLCDEIGGAYLEADGLCYGVPTLKPGQMVQIANIGERFSTRYTVTATTHVYTPAEGYSTLFAVTGKRPETLLSLLHSAPRSDRAPLGGNIVVGIVTDNNDPLQQGRVKVMYPWLTEEHTSFWARTVSQMAGKGRGMFNIPEINDEVLVAFEHGEVTRPYIIGMLWNGKDGMPATKGNPMHGPASEINRRGLYSRIGHQIHMDDTGGQGDITLRTAGGHVLTLNDAGKQVEITTTGGHKLVLDDAGKQIAATTTGGHKITMSDAANSITVQDNAGDMVHLQQGMITMSAVIMMNLVAPMINIAGEVAVNIAGLVTNMVAGATCNMVGAAAVTATSAGLVQVSGESAVSVTSGMEVGIEGGKLVDINASLVTVNT